METSSQRSTRAWRRQLLVTAVVLPVFLTLAFWDAMAVVGLPYRLNGILGLSILAAFAVFTWRNSRWL